MGQVVSQPALAFIALVGCPVGCEFQQLQMEPWDDVSYVVEDGNGAAASASASASASAAANWSAVQLMSNAGSEEGEVVVETETAMYGLNKLASDVGGYMGLLLEVSLMSAYDSFVSLFAKKTK